MDNPSAAQRTGQKLIPISELFRKSFALYKSRLYLILTLALIPFANFIISDWLYGMSGSKGDNLKITSGWAMFALLFSLFAIVVNIWVQITYFYAVKEKDITH